MKISEVVKHIFPKHIKKIDCENCSGTGFVKGSRDGKSYSKKCPTCHGWGWFPEKSEPDIQKIRANDKD
jgi:DnaJ-class molecular chaperone